jgi:ribonuclease VapC
VTDGLVVDTSAVVAVLQTEAGSDALIALLGAAGRRVMSAATRVELGIVVEARFGPAGGDVVERFIRDAGITVVAVDSAMADRALSAWRRFGKGRHRAALNFGDCFSYALAEHSGLPLLCTGSDFAATDLELAR